MYQANLKIILNSVNMAKRVKYKYIVDYFRPRVKYISNVMLCYFSQKMHNAIQIYTQACVTHATCLLDVF